MNVYRFHATLTSNSDRRVCTEVKEDILAQSVNHAFELVEKHLLSRISLGNRQPKHLRPGWLLKR